MRLVHGARERAADAPHGAEHGIGDGFEVAPSRRDLERVDDESTADQRREHTHVVAVREPPVDERGVESIERFALLVDDRHRRIDDHVVAFIEHEEHARVDVEAPLALGLVVEAKDGGRRAALHDAAARVEPVAEARDPECCRPSRAVRGAGAGARR